LKLIPLLRPRECSLEDVGNLSFDRCDPAMPVIGVLVLESRDALAYAASPANTRFSSGVVTISDRFCRRSE
jgi:hypothetical protein